MAELGFERWTERVNQKLTFILLNVRERRDISEDDYELLRVLHKIHWFGEYPLYEHEGFGGIKEENVTQTCLFDIPAKENTDITGKINPYDDEAR